MITSIWKSRLAVFGLAVVVLGAVACEQDEISGPVNQIGPPLLDIELQPSTPVYPSANLALNATDDTLVVRFANLPPLPTGSVYQVLLVDSASTSAVVGSGQLVVTTLQSRPLTRDSALVDTTTDTTASVSAIDVWGPNRTAELTITDADIGGNIAAYSHAVVAVTASPGSTTITADDPIGFLARPIGDGNMTFGTWALNSAVRQPFSIQGSSANAAFWGDEFIANFERILRPPFGFEYVAWMIDGRTDIQYRIGGLTTPPPERRSLANADVEDGSFLTDVAIVEGYLRGPADIPDNYQRLVITLEPKSATGAPRASTAEVFAANIPTSVASRHPSPGRLAGQVSGPGNLDSTTVFLTGRGQTTPLLVAITDAAGEFLIRTVPIGDYTVNVIPLGGTMIVDTEDITISPVPAPGGGFVGDSVFVNLTIP
jgi:hypothetical protein